MTATDKALRVSAGGAPLSRRVRAVCAGAIAVCAATCALPWEAEEKNQDELLLAGAALALNAPASAGIELRFGDGGTDAIHQFSTGSVAVSLSGTNRVELDRVELGMSATAPRSLLRMVGGPPEQMDDAATGPRHDTTGSSGTTILGTAGGPLQIDPFSAGTSGLPVDRLGRPYYAPALITASTRSGLLDQITVHLSRVTLSGTLNGGAFTADITRAVDYTVSLRCPQRISAGGTPRLLLYFDLSALFRNLATATESAARTTIDQNLTNADLIREAECNSF